MPKPRKSENKGLPKRWRFFHNAYYYRVPPGLEYLWDGKTTFRLGKTLPAAYRAWADRVEYNETAGTISELLDRYLLEVMPLKAPRTRINQIRIAEKLRQVFGNMKLLEIEPRHIYAYVSKRAAKVAAHREVEVLSHLFTKAVEWGYINRHPFKGEVRLQGEKPRTRYVTDEEVTACLSLKPRRKKDVVTVIQAYIRLKLLTGLRRGDLLRMKMTDEKEDGLHVNTHKTGKPIIYEWSDELRAAVQLAKAARPTQLSQFLFCTRRGKGYMNEETGEPSGWASIWQRFMKRVMSETEVKERFTEHDLRAKTASDAENLEHARALLAHVESRTTQKFYRRKPEKVKPAR